jgi:hypothetical protein
LHAEGKAESPSVSALLTLQEGLKELAARWKAACEHETQDEPSAWACAEELSALLSSLLLGQEKK